MLGDFIYGFFYLLNLGAGYKDSYNATATYNLDVDSDSDPPCSQRAARTASAPETETTRSVSTWSTDTQAASACDTLLLEDTKTYADVGNLEVVNDERVALRAGAKVDRGQVLGQAELRRPLRIGVREREDLSHRIKSAIANYMRAIMREAKGGFRMWGRAAN